MWSPTMVLTGQLSAQLRRSDGMQCIQSPMTMDARQKTPHIYMSSFIPLTTKPCPLFCTLFSNLKGKTLVHYSIQNIDRQIAQTSKGRSILSSLSLHSNLHFFHSAHLDRWPTAWTYKMGSWSKEGECKVFRIGGVTLEMLKGKLRMYGPFFHHIWRRRRRKNINLTFLQHDRQRVVWIKLHFKMKCAAKWAQEWNQAVPPNHYRRVPRTDSLPIPPTTWAIFRMRKVNVRISDTPLQPRYSWTQARAYSKMITTLRP